jgi:thiol-disulfide isomerase/thioredoxin
MADLRFHGFVDGTDEGALVYDETATQDFSLEEYYAGFDPDARIIVVNTAAGWCPPCQDEARDLARLNDKYASQGVRFVTAIFQTDGGDPATEDFVRTWARLFQITVPTMVDTDFILEDYLDLNAMPTNIFVNAHTMKIISVLAGNGGPAAFDQILDYYLAHQE